MTVEQCVVNPGPVS